MKRIGSSLYSRSEIRRVFDLRQRFRTSRRRMDYCYFETSLAALNGESPSRAFLYTYLTPPPIPFPSSYPDTPDDFGPRRKNVFLNRSAVAKTKKKVRDLCHITRVRVRTWCYDVTMLCHWNRARADYRVDERHGAKGRVAQRNDAKFDFDIQMRNSI